MKVVDPKEISLRDFHKLLLGVVCPRPIAFASTIDNEGKVNLSPFSYFNAFSANPPILVFSPARRGRDNTTKHTYENVLEVPEVVVNIVNYEIVEQASLSSTEYAKGINEFVKAGLTQVPSEKIKPPRVGESPVSFECRVNDVVQLGNEGGAGNLVICEILLVHINEDILDEHEAIDPNKLDAVGRMGGNFYCRAYGDALFEVPKPLKTIGVGIDQLPESIKKSDVLTGKHLARLASVEEIPDVVEINDDLLKEKVNDVQMRFKNDMESLQYHVHLLAKDLVEEGKTDDAWKVLLQNINGR